LTSSDSIDPAAADHPLKVIKTEEVEFEGQKYVVRRLKHREMLESDKEGNAWHKRDESISANEAANYCAMSKFIVHPHFTAEELREGDGTIVRFLNGKMNDLCFLSPMARKSPISSEGSSSEQILKEQQNGSVTRNEQ
jgi:hypothetical protein